MFNGCVRVGFGRGLFHELDQLKYSPPIAKKVGVVTEVMWPQARWVGVVPEVM